MKLNIQLFAYTKKEWKDLPSKETPILAADLNNIENGIATNLSPDAYYGKTEIDNKENKLKAENEYLNSVIEQAFTPVEKEGTSINYDNTINARFKDIKLCGDTTQNGTPTPDAPVPVNVVSGDNEINICGKNLFNGETELGTFSTTNGEKTASTTTRRSVNKIPVKPNQQYVFSQNGTAIAVRIYYYQENETFISTEAYTNGIITTPNNCYYVNFISDKILSNYNDIQLEQGNQASNYEPYQGNTYNIDLPIELCKIGDYQDRIYQDNNKWYLEKQIGKVVLDGSENWFAETQRYRVDNIIQGKAFTSFDENNPLAYCEGFKWGNGSSSNFVNGAFWYTSNGLNLSLQKDENPNATTLANFKTWLGSNNQNVRYVLANPTTTEITDTTLLEQLEELAGAKTYAGETNIVATSDGLTIIPKTTALTK